MLTDQGYRAQEAFACLGCIVACFLVSVNALTICRDLSSSLCLSSYVHMRVLGVLRRCGGGVPRESS